MGSGISVPKPRAGIAPDPLLRAILVKRSLSLSTTVSPPRDGPGGLQSAAVADQIWSGFEPVRSNPSILRPLGAEPAFRDHFFSRVESDGVGTLRIEITVN